MAAVSVWIHVAGVSWQRLVPGPVSSLDCLLGWGQGRRRLRHLRHPFAPLMLDAAARDTRVGPLVSKQVPRLDILPAPAASFQPYIPWNGPTQPHLATTACNTALDCRTMTMDACTVSHLHASQRLPERHPRVAIAHLYQTSNTCCIFDKLTRVGL